MRADGIPIIDVSPLERADASTLRKVADELCLAAETAGFFYIKNHGVPQTLIDESFAIARAFFGAADQYKRGVSISPFHRGWLQVGEAKMYGSAEPDFKESFIWGLDISEDDPDFQAGGRLLAPNRWPEFVAGMRETLVAYFQASQACGERLLKAFAVGLDVAPDYFLQAVDKPVSRGSLIYYPPPVSAQHAERFGANAHTDYGVLTLLYQDEVGGLQIRGKSGGWMDAMPIEGAYVVNAGDLLARWSNGRFESTPHRVMTPPGRARYSIAMFVDPNWDAVVEPVTKADETAKFGPVRCAAYIKDRFDEAFAYRKAEVAARAGK